MGPEPGSSISPASGGSGVPLHQGSCGEEAGAGGVSVKPRALPVGKDFRGRASGSWAGPGHMPWHMLAARHQSAGPQVARGAQGLAQPHGKQR